MEDTVFNSEKVRQRNKSKLTYIDCCMILMDWNLPFENMNDDDLDLLYFVAFSRWAYHLTKQGYIDILNRYRTDHSTF